LDLCGIAGNSGRRDDGTTERTYAGVHARDGLDWFIDVSKLISDY
jgi:hypothetical protein